MTCPDIHLRGPICAWLLIWNHCELIGDACVIIYPLEQHVAWDLEYHDKKEHKLVSKIDRGLIYSDVCGKASCEGAG